jgi:sugar lactone lactonase YvrE
VTIATVLAMAGIRCGPADPTLIAQADLNVPVPDPWQLETGFGSVWVSSRENQAVHRVDPDTGEQLAVIEVDSLPIKLQPADGRMILRTEDAYVAIDPATNTVVDTLAMADVGPAAGRSWAVDGALWICDGQRLHRYDPVSFEPVTTIELGFDCGQVYATDDLVIPWSFNQDPGESGASVAAFVDPATNQIAATIDLPADVNVPVVLDDEVLFPPSGSEPAVVVDRATHTVTSRIDVGEGWGSQPAFDGTSVYFITVGDGHNITVIDPETLAITETIEAFDFDAPFGGRPNALATSPGALWVVSEDANLLQRFDRPT